MLKYENRILAMAQKLCKWLKCWQSNHELMKKYSNIQCFCCCTCTHMNKNRVAYKTAQHMYKYCSSMFFIQRPVCVPLAGNAKIWPGQTTVCQKRPDASIFPRRGRGSSQFEALSWNVAYRLSANGFGANAKKKDVLFTFTVAFDCWDKAPRGHYLPNGYFPQFESDCWLVLTVWVPIVTCQLMLNNNKRSTVGFNIVVLRIYVNLPCLIVHVLIRDWGNCLFGEEIGKTNIAGFW